MTTPSTRRSSRPTWVLAASAAVGPVLSAVGALLVAASRDRFPERIAVHWGPSGQADRFQTLVPATITAALMTSLVPLVLVGIGAVIDRSARGPLAGLAAGVATFVGGLGFGSMLAQRDGAAPLQFPWPWLLPVAAVAVIVGVGFWRLGRLAPPPLGGPRPPLPADAERLDVPTTTRLAWTRTAALPRRGVLAICAFGIAPLVVVAVVGQPWVLGLAVVLGALLAVTFSARVDVDRSGLRISSLGLTWSRVPLERVASAERGSVSPLREFGGWGWRIGRDGRRGYVTRAGEALVVHRIGEPPVVVTVDDADEAAAVLNTLASRVQ